MLGVTRREPIQEVVVDGIHKKLTPARVLRARVGHGQGERFVAQLRRELIGDVAAAVALDLLPGLQVLIARVLGEENW